MEAKHIQEKFHKGELKTTQRKEGKKSTMGEHFSEVVNQDELIIIMNSFGHDNCLVNLIL